MRVIFTYYVLVLALVAGCAAPTEPEVAGRMGALAACDPDERYFGDVPEEERTCHAGWMYDRQKRCKTRDPQCAVFGPNSNELGQECTARKSCDNWNAQVSTSTKRVHFTKVREHVEFICQPRRGGGETCSKPLYFNEPDAAHANSLCQGAADAAVRSRKSVVPEGVRRKVTAKSAWRTVRKSAAHAFEIACTYTVTYPIAVNKRWDEPGFKCDCESTGWRYPQCNVYSASCGVETILSNSEVPQAAITELPGYVNDSIACMSCQGRLPGQSRYACLDASLQRVQDGNFGARGQTSAQEIQYAQARLYEANGELLTEEQRADARALYRRLNIPACGDIEISLPFGCQTEDAQRADADWASCEYSLQDPAFRARVHEETVEGRRARAQYASEVVRCSTAARQMTDLARGGECAAFEDAATHAVNVTMAGYEHLTAGPVDRDSVEGVQDSIRTLASLWPMARLSPDARDRALGVFWRAVQPDDLLSKIDTEARADIVIEALALDQSRLSESKDRLLTALAGLEPQEVPAEVLLEITADVLAPLVERLERRAGLFDLACAIGADCRSSAYARAWQQMAVLGGGSTLGLVDTTLLGRLLRQREAIKQAVVSVATNRPDAERWLDDAVLELTAGQRVQQYIRRARTMTAIVLAENSVNAADLRTIRPQVGREELDFAASVASESYLPPLVSELNNYAMARKQVLQALVSAYGQEGNLSALENRAAEKRSELARTNKEVAALREQFASLNRELSAAAKDLDGLFTQQGHRMVEVQAPRSVQVSASDADANGPLASLTELRDAALDERVTLTPGNVLEVGVGASQRYNPVCLLTSLTDAEWPVGLPTVSFAEGTCGSQGFSLSRSGQTYSLHSTTFSTSSGERRYTTNREELCGGGSLSFPIVLGNLVGKSWCDGSGTETYTSRDNTRSDSRGESDQLTASFEQGLFLPGAPVPEAPVGALLAVAVDDGTQEVIDVKVVTDGTRVENQLDGSVTVYFIVNDVDCSRGAEPYALTMEYRVLAREGSLLNALARGLGAMRTDLITQRVEVGPFGQLLPGEGSAQTARAWEVLNRHLVSEGIASGTGALTAGQRLLVDRLIAGEVLQLERRMQIATQQRHVEELAASIEGLRREVTLASAGTRAIDRVLSDAVSDMRSAELETLTAEALQYVHLSIRPALELWYPDILPMVAAGRSRELDTLTSADSSLEDMARAATSLMERLLALVKGKGADSTRTAWIAVRVPRAGWADNGGASPNPGGGDGVPDLGGLGALGGAADASIETSADERATCWNALPDERAELFWRGIDESGRTLLQLDWEDLYQAGSQQCAALSCWQAVPVVQHAGLFFVRSGRATQNDDLNAANLSIVMKTPDVWEFPSEDGMIRYLDASGAYDRTSWPSYFGEFQDALRVAQSSERSSPTGFSPAGTWEIDFSGGAWDELHDAEEAIVVMRVEYRDADYSIADVPVCGGAN